MRDRANDSRPIRTAFLDFSDSKNGLLRLKWNDIEKDAENPNPYATVTIDHNASGGTKLIILLNIGASATDYEQYQFSAYATGIADPGGIDATPTHTQVLTLGALVDALNALHDSDIGIYAARLHGPADYSLDTGDFITQAVARISPFFTEMLYKDASEVKTAAFRLGVPEDANGKVGRGRIEIVRIVAFANSNSATDCVFKMSYDPTEGSGGADDEVELAYSRYVPDAAITELYDFHEAPPVEKGPILVELTATTTLTEDTTYARIAYRNAEY